VETVIEFWQAWWNGEQQHFVVLWLPAYAWARIGKVLEFVAALFIIADIIGPKRLREWGSNLMNSDSIARTLALNRNMVTWAYLEFRLYWAEEGTAAFQELRRRVEPFRRDRIAFCLSWASLVLVLASTWFTLIPPKDFHWSVLMVLGMLGPAFLLTPFWSMLVALVSSVPFLLLGYATMVLARLLEREDVEKVYKKVSVGVLIVGFLLDFLGS
jgi:hypothetical protein